MVSINELAGIVMQIADKKLTIEHVEGPEGVRGRNSDNTRLREVLNWDPSTDLEQGLAETYRWIEKQLIERDCVHDHHAVDVLGVGISAINPGDALREISRGSPTANSTTCVSRACTGSWKRSTIRS